MVFTLLAILDMHASNEKEREVTKKLARHATTKWTNVMKKIEGVKNCMRSMDMKQHIYLLNSAMKNV